MSQIFELKDPFILGKEKDETYGWSWRSHTDGELPVQFSSHKENIVPGTRIMAEKVDQKIAKSSGKPYLWLSGLKFEDSPTDTKEQLPFTDKPAPAFSKPEKTDKAYLKDLSDYPVRLYIGNLNYAKDIGMKLVDDETDFTMYLEYIKRVTDELLAWSDNIRNGSNGNSGSQGNSPPSAINEEKTPSPATNPVTGYDKFQQQAKSRGWADEPPLSDEDYPGADI